MRRHSVFGKVVQSSIDVHRALSIQLPQLLPQISPLMWRLWVLSLLYLDHEFGFRWAVLPFSKHN